jgi:hypothetical protein
VFEKRNNEQSVVCGFVVRALVGNESLAELPTLARWQ